MENSHYSRNWMKVTLRLAALYNLLWGGFGVLFPSLYFEWLNIPTPQYLGFWQCIAMIVGVYSIGYFVASFNPLRHWPIVLIGFLGKILGPIGFVINASNGKLPWKFGYTIIINDLIWLIPFALILRAAYLRFIHEEDSEFDLYDSPDEALEKSFTNNFSFIKELSSKSPVLLVLLRHKGCTFCREALSDIKKVKKQLDDEGVKLVLVHMGNEADGKSFLKKYGLDSAPIVNDPHRVLYRSLGLKRGSAMQLLGPYCFVRGVIAGIFKGHGLGPLQGDGFQMPGLFYIKDGKVKKSFHYSSAASRPDYLKFIQKSQTDVL